jgi:hypothetical protein
MSRKFPIEIIRPDKHINIKSKHFAWSENSTSIADIEPLRKWISGSPPGDVNTYLIITDSHNQD